MATEQQRGEACKVQTAVPRDVHARMRREKHRRLMQGQECTIEGLLLECLMKCLSDFPRIPDGEEE